LDAALSTTAGLWLAVVASGLYHGINPAMGWPLSVSAALMDRRASALVAALGALALGHFAAMAAILLPFAALDALIRHQREIRVGAALIVITTGIVLFIRNRHPRLLARIPPSRLALWSLLAATAHGAGLMLVPIYLGLCTAAELAADAGHQAAAGLMARNVLIALEVALAHGAAMIAAGGMLAVAVYRVLGLSFISKSWFNLDRVWAVSLVLVGAIGLWAAY
jgi:hypothetical protein